MNRTIATLILTVSATFGVASLQAQDRASAVIPFPFQVKGRTLPAGKYDVNTLSTTNTSLFSVSDRAGHSLFVGAPLQSKADPSDPKLTFSCYGGKCSLAKIGLPGSDVSYSIVPSSTHSIGMASMIAIRVTR